MAGGSALNSLRAARWVAGHTRWSLRCAALGCVLLLRWLYVHAQVLLVDLGFLGVIVVIAILLLLLLLLLLLAVVPLRLLRLRLLLLRCPGRASARARRCRRG